MSTESLPDQIGRLSNLYSLIDVLRMDKQRKIDEILTPEIKAALQALDDEFKDKEDALQGNIQTLENAIKDAVIQGGESVKAAGLHVVFSKPRITWDSKRLDGYMAAHPEIGEFRRMGSASASIRKVG